MPPEEHPIDPRFAVEMGDARLDPKDAAVVARRRAAAAAKRLASALGVDPEAVPGAERPAYLLQFEHDPSAETVRRFRTEHGLKLTEGPSPVAFVERMDRRTAGRVRRDPAVRACIPLPPRLKLTGLSSVSSLGPEPVARVGLFPDTDIPRLRAAVQAVGLRVIHLDEARDRSGAATMHVRVPSDDALADLIAFDEVRWVAPVPEVRVNNVDTAGVNQGGGAGTHSVWAKGLHGEDMVIGVMDPGIVDMQSKFFSDAAHATPGPGHRKVVELRRIPASAPARHATSVAACAVADEDGRPGANAARGGAWAAKLTYGDVMRAFTGAPVSSLPAELAAAAGARARIHSNSWGVGSTAAPPPYDQIALDADEFTFDNEHHLLVVASANSADPGHQGGIVLSKNAVAVNACRTAPNQDQFFDGKSGVTADGRRKPDLVAVGESMTTADLTGGGASPLAVVTHAGGTSVAAPHVAAAAALVRQYFAEGFYPNGKKQPRNGLTPSGALLKAVLLNATVDLTGVPGYPSAREGWGRLQLDQALHFDGDKLRLSVWDVRHTVGLDRDGATKTLSLDVPSGAKRMKCTLVFTDPPGAVGAADPVVNKLDLEAAEPIPRRFSYFGNDFSAGVSARRDPAAAGFTRPPDPTDLKNNVRQIVVPAPAAGRWQLIVHAYKVDQARTPVQPLLLRSTQGYALVVCVELT